MNDSRRYPRYPLLGVGALIFDHPQQHGDRPQQPGDRGRILLALRGKPPLLGQWSLPGGLVETGEKLTDAVRREVREETGLEIEPLGVLEIFERIMPDASGAAEYHYVLIDYVCAVTGGALAAGDDACQVAWFEPSELAALDITEGTLAVIEKAFAKGENIGELENLR